MQFINHLAVFAWLFCVASAFEAVQDASPLEARQDGCVNGVHVVATGGQGATQGNLGYLASLANGIVARIPESEIYQIAYPSGQENGAAAVAYGVPALHEHIGAFTARCPRTKIVTIGYSIGAAVTMNCLCGEAQAAGANALPNRFTRNILANVVYGDLTFLPGKKYDRGSCTLPGKIPRQNPVKCYPFGKKTQSYCDATDPECCSGTDPNIHFTYPAKYDQASIDFIDARWQLHKAK